VTGGLEALAAALIATPAARVAGLALGAAICVAAVATVVRHKENGRVAPGAVLTALSALDLALLAAGRADADRLSSCSPRAAPNRARWPVWPGQLDRDFRL
jgi:hypothetical protein